MSIRDFKLNIAGKALVLAVFVLASFVMIFPSAGYAADTTPFLVVKQVAKKGQGQDKWSTNNTANPGETLKYVVGYMNTSDTEQKQVVVRDILPGGMALVPGTTKLTDSLHPSGVKVDNDAIAGSGLNLGNFSKDANAYLTFEVKLPTADKLKCGTNEFKNVGSAKPEGLEQKTASAVTKVVKDCSPDNSAKPVYSCDALSLSTKGGLTVEASAKYTAKNGAKLKNVTYEFNDGTKPVVTNKTAVKHTYKKDGTYIVAASAAFTVNGQAKKASSDKCAKPITLTSGSSDKEGGATPSSPADDTPSDEELADTGPGEVVGLFAVTAIFGALAHRFALARKLNHQ